MTQLSTPFGYAWAVTAGSSFWDDASYFQAYGSRAGGTFNSSAVVAIAPAAGRYHYQCWCEASFSSPAVRITTTHMYAVWEHDTTGSPSSAFDITPALSTASNGDVVGVEIDVVLYLGVGGCVGMQSIFSSSPSHDLVVTGYQYIEYLGA